jgi:uncharacterized protein (TIGR03437 family)
MSRLFRTTLLWLVPLLPALADTAWRPTGSMSSPRRDHAAALLPNAKVLVAGYLTNSAELFDGSTGQFTPVGRMQFLHGQGLTATVLKTGKVLFVGGTDAQTSAELYDPSSERFTVTESTTAAHSYHTATLLNDGRVLVVGGLASRQSSDVAEIYDPATGKFTTTATLGTPREGHTATLLPDGRVLIAGGVEASSSASSALDTAEIFDPASDMFAPAQHPMIAPRYAHYAILLATGQVLLGGGFPDSSAELFDPATSTFTQTGRMTVARGAATATLLPSGQVLVAGGFTGPSVTNTTELYDPATGIFNATGSMNTPREEHRATALFDGRVLVTGGFNTSDLSSAELYTPVSEGLLTSLSGLTFRAAAGSTQTASQNLAILSPTSEIPWKVSVTTYSGGSWLTTNPSNATSQPAVGALAMTVTANPAGLAAGDYYGVIAITPTDGIHPPVDVSVVLNIVAPNTPVPPQVAPAGLVFLTTAGATPNPQSVSITDLTSHAIGATLTSPQFGNGLSVSRQSLVVNSGETQSFSVSLDTANLAAGVYRYSINLAFTDTTNQVVDILLVVAPGALPAPAAVSKNLRTYDQGGAGPCTPTQLLPVFTTLDSGFNTPAAWPTAVIVGVVDDCATPVSAGNVRVTFGNGDPPLALLSLGDGTWTSTWTPSHSESGFKITAAAQLLQPALEGKVEITGGVPSNPDVPLVTPGGVVSAADYASSPALGLLVSAFGSGFSNEIAGAQHLPLPTNLGSTSIVLGGEVLPLLFADSGQLNFVIPYDLAPKTQYQLIVQHGNAISVPVTVTVMSAQPAILSADGSGKGQGHIYAYHTFGAVLADEKHPAQAGQTLVMYCVGLGPVDPAVHAGSGAPVGGPLSKTTGNVTVTIGGQQAHVDFAGLAPGFAGLYQVNSVVPSGITADDKVPVTVSVSGQNSIADITMAVQ